MAVHFVPGTKAWNQIQDTLQWNPQSPHWRRLPSESTSNPSSSWTFLPQITIRLNESRFICKHLGFRARKTAPLTLPTTSHTQSEYVSVPLRRPPHPVRQCPKESRSFRKRGQPSSGRIYESFSPPWQEACHMTSCCRMIRRHKQPIQACTQWSMCTVSIYKFN